MEQKGISKQTNTGGLSPEMYSKVLSSIKEINGQPVILDADVATLYGVETRVVNQAVKRNLERFPSDYRFQLSEGDIQNLKSQNVTSSWGGNRKLPYAFTEKGLYATVLKSRRAVEQSERMHRFSELLSDIVMPDLETTETESTLELNFFIGKIKHTVKRVKKNDVGDQEEDK